MKQKLFVLSMDAMVHEDIAKLEKKPNFQKILQKRAEVERVCSVYPASTYPAHTTLMTGCYPGKHRIYNNYPLLTVSDGHTHWPLYSKYVYAEDIFAAAKRAGCTTAAVYWPLTGCNPNIDHVIDEYFFEYKEEHTDPEAVFARLGADELALEIVREHRDLMPIVRTEKTHLRHWLWDDFIMACTCSLIRKAQPDVLLVHNCYLDTVRHRGEIFREEVDEGLDITDAWLGDVIAAMEEAGTFEQTNFVLLSDHGQMTYNRSVKLNVLFREKGLLEVAPDGTVYDWEAFSQSNGMSTSVFLRDHTNEQLYRQVYDYLLQLQAEGIYGIEHVFTAKELKERYGQGGAFSFIVESDGKTHFSSSWKGEPLVQLEPEKQKGSHGYMPEKGPQPVFLAHGPAFRENACIPNAKLVDIAPTLAATFGQQLPQADGQCLSALLK